MDGRRTTTIRAEGIHTRRGIGAYLRPCRRLQTVARGRRKLRRDLQPTPLPPKSRALKTCSPPGPPALRHPLPPSDWTPATSTHNSRTFHIQIHTPSSAQSTCEDAISSNVQTSGCAPSDFEDLCHRRLQDWRHQGRHVPARAGPVHQLPGESRSRLDSLPAWLGLQLM